MNKTIPLPERHPSSVFMLQQTRRGVCNLCELFPGGERPQNIVAEDRLCGWLLCRGCVQNVIFAQRALHSVNHTPDYPHGLLETNCGIRQPNPTEIPKNR